MYELEIIRLNIERFRRMLKTDLDLTTRRAVQSMIEEFEAKLPVESAQTLTKARRGIKERTIPTTGRAREPHSHAERVPDVSVQERREYESVKRITKLRWIGMKAEAE